MLSRGCKGGQPRHGSPHTATARISRTDGPAGVLGAEAQCRYGGDGDSTRHRTVAGGLPHRRDRSGPGVSAPAARHARCLVFGAPAVGSGDPGQAGVTAGAERRRDCLGREPRASPGDGDRPLPRVDARRPVVVALASATEVSAALQALRNAGIRLRTSRRRRSRWVRSRGCAARCRCRAQSRRTQGCAGAAEASSAEVVRASG